MIIMVEVTYPGTKVDQAATMFVERLKTNPPPDFVKILEMYALAGGEGIRALMFYDVENGKEKEGTDYIARGVVNMLKSIEGYKASVFTVYPMAEAYGILDMQPPAL